MSEKEILLKANENGKQISTKWDEIAEKYAGNVIAVENGKVIGSAKTSSGLIKMLEEEKKDISSISIISVPQTNVAYIL